jgi:hypothetical protein
VTPTPEELRAYLDSHNLTSRLVGEALAVSDRTVRYWCNADHPNNIPFSAWIAIRLMAEHPDIFSDMSGPA